MREHNTHACGDLAAGDVFRVALCLLPGAGTRLQIDLDMMAGDALSLRVLLSDLRDFYESPGAMPVELGLDYRQYLAERERRRGPEREQDAAWWRERLGELPGAPRLPTTVDPLTPVQAGDASLTHSRRLHHWLDPEAKAALISRARRHGVTPAAALPPRSPIIAAWSGSQRFLLNLPLFDREMFTPEVANSLRRLQQFGPARRGHERPAALRPPGTTGTGRAPGRHLHSSYSGVEVLRDLARLEGAPVLAPVVYTSAIGLGEIFEQDVQKSFGRPVWIISQGPQVFLDAQVTELDGGFLLNWDVRDGLFEPGVPEAAFDAYQRLITGLVTDPSAWTRPVGALLGPDVLSRRAVAVLPPTPQPVRRPAHPLLPPRRSRAGTARRRARERRQSHIRSTRA